jgi:hypothetical protein
MAFYNSIALGTASGKLGNLTFQAYKKMKIVRQKNETTSNLNAPERLIVKRKLKNLTILWVVFKDFFKYFTLDKQFVESNYNLFVRKFYSIITSQFLPSLSIIWAGLVAYSEDNSSDFLWIEVTRNQQNDNTYLFLYEFYPFFLEFRTDMRIRYLISDSHFVHYKVLDIPLTLELFNQKYFEIITDNSADYVNCVAYIYFTGQPNCSDIKFFNPYL